MSVSSASAPGSKAIAANALRNAGLIDRDATMRDGTDTAGGRKGRLRSGRVTRMTDIMKDRPMSGARTHPIRLSQSAGSSDPLSIRGAARPLPRSLRRPLDESKIPVRMPALRTKVVDAWREFVQKRYSAETKFLNLDSMVEDEVVKKYNLTPPGSGGSSRDAAVIFKLAKELKPEVETLSLANNKLSGVHLKELSKYLPKLLNLSLANNKIAQRADLRFISGRNGTLSNLKELVLVGNPLREDAYSAGKQAAYRSDIARRFSALEVLDQEPITQISFDQPEASTSNIVVEKPNATSFPFEMGPSFLTGVDGNLISNFLSRYFAAFDSQRDALIDAYDPAATFSFSANTTIPTRARISGFHSSSKMPNQRKLDWKPWLESGSRNLNRIAGDPEKTLSNLHVGVDRVVEAIKKLPGTKHDITGPSEKFVLDAFPVPHGQTVGLLTMVHGEFTEIANGGVRSFDRTFMLLPAPAGSRAKMNNWDCIILSDQWIIRSYSSNEAWRPGPMLVQALPSTKGGDSSASAMAGDSPMAPSTSLPTLPPDQQAALAQLPELQRNLVLEVCRQTRLNVRFSIDCLANNAWDLGRAIANFNQVKHTLSQDAFN